MSCPGAGRLQVEWVTGRDLSPLEGVWRELLHRDPDATIFQSWEWVEAWWQHFGRGRRLVALVAYEEGAPLALAPFAVRRVGGCFRQVECLGAGVSDYLGFIGPQSALPACIERFAAILADARGWDLIYLPLLHPAQAESVARAQPVRGLSFRISPHEVCPVLALPATWEELLPRLGKKLRANLGYYERLLRRDGTLSLETASLSDLDTAMEEFFALHARRWRRRWQPGALFSGRRRAFHRAVARALCHTGNLALHRLRWNGATVAVLYCFHYQRRAYYYLGGFDPAMARYSPGTLLTGYAIQAAIRAGCVEFDFLRGREAYKYRWPVEERQIACVEIAREGSFRSRLALRRAEWLRRMETHGKRLLHGR
ncbi:MAG: GNAT family N-acetyltransferase [Armatimonadota bacterium]|nr:GNAT family N-acetyltransferase [Armatimonadota bacterium]